MMRGMGPRRRALRASLTLAILATLAVGTSSATKWPDSAATGPRAGTGVAQMRLATERPYRATISRLPADVRDRMVGSSWRKGCPVGLRKLRLIRLTHWNFNRERVWGKLLVHRAWARKVKHVFGRIYDARFPIRRMQLVDRYGADDTKSMKHDNTSAFNCRYRNGVCCVWSMHAYGKAIDINPVENPYVGSWGVSPDNGAPYVDRTKKRKGMIFRRDHVWWAFHAISWEWGGTWSGAKDYQHFSSNGR